MFAGSPSLPLVELEDFPGGPSNFERLARHCYGQSVGSTDDSVVSLLCGATVLQMADLTATATAMLTDAVLPSLPKSAVALAEIGRITGAFSTEGQSLTVNC